MAFLKTTDSPRDKDVLRMGTRIELLADPASIEPACVPMKPLPLALVLRRADALGVTLDLHRYVREWRMYRILAAQDAE